MGYYKKAFTFWGTVGETEAELADMRRDGFNPVVKNGMLIPSQGYKPNTQPQRQYQSFKKQAYKVVETAPSFTVQGFDSIEEARKWQAIRLENGTCAASKITFKGREVE